MLKLTLRVALLLTLRSLLLIQFGISSTSTASVNISSKLGDRDDKWNSADYSGNIDLSLSKFHFDRGIYGERVEDITQDSCAYIWVKTGSEWLRFDKKSFTSHKTISSHNRGGDSLNLDSISSSISSEYDINFSKISDELIRYTIINTHRCDTIIGLSGIDRELTVSHLENAIYSSTDRKIWFSIPFRGVGFIDCEKSDMFWIKNISQYSLWSRRDETFSKLYDNRITTLFLDSEGNLWIGTELNGLFRLAFIRNYLFPHKISYENNHSLQHQDVSYPLVMSDGSIWLSTYGGGINIWKRDDIINDRVYFRRIEGGDSGSSPLLKGPIFPLLESSSGEVWCGTSGSGLFRLNLTSRGVIDSYRCYRKKEMKVSTDTIWALCEDNEGRIWIGSRGGLTRYDPKSDTFISTFDELFNSTQFLKKSIVRISLTSDNQLWISTWEGDIYSWNLDENIIRYFPEERGDRPGLIYTKGVEADSVIWFGGVSGLYKYRKLTDSFINYNVIDGVNLGYISSMERDRYGALWCGTDRGIICFNPATGEIDKSVIEGGVLCNNFTQGSSKDSLGHIYFGTRNGFVKVIPENYYIDKSKREGITPIITSIVAGADTLFYVDTDKSIKLKYDQADIVFEFVNIESPLDEMDHFEVMLEGIDSEWRANIEGQSRWNSIKPGDYIFRLRDINKRGEVTVRIKVLPPWWLTGYFIVVVLLGVAVIIVLLLSRYRRYVKSRESIRQKSEFDRQRFSFFLNISHEIRTPLTLIEGGVERLRDQIVDQELLSEIDRVYRNTKRLSKLTGEVLDLKQLDNRMDSVLYKRFDIVSFIYSVIDSFKIKEDEIDISFKTNFDSLWIETDRDIIEGAMYNLLSNAIKYSYDNITIKVELFVDNGRCIISITDRGEGIEKVDIERIFDRFYRRDSKRSVGSGIGLWLVRERMGEIEGYVSVESEVNVGSCFSINFPYIAVESSHVETTEDHLLGRDMPSMVIVDDNIDIRSFVKEMFISKYNIFEASDGGEGIDLVRRIVPDIVISDVMMPICSGVELCRKLKGDIVTSHIPIILLTAKSGEDAELAGVEAKADAYITKPFSESLLIKSVEREVGLRQELYRYYSTLSDKTVDKGANILLKLLPVDREFISKVMSSIESNIAEREYGVERLASDVALSSSSLYKKLKAVSGLSPVEYIRRERLKKASLLLKESSLSIIEISEQCGFGSSKYFSVQFKNYYNESPSRYRVNPKNREVDCH